MLPVRANAQGASQIPPRALTHTPSQKPQDMDSLLPEITRFCELMIVYQEDEFVFRQLLGVSKYLDPSDEAGRRQLTQLYR